eukprot:CAMPEP_0172745310 /NCGR_PEP_ID=MMETSP1074-20121228/137579_1 /TAXON_ID=2916 /ORGANISM="Ceratium fusus, Strain PA161109" /LENGTH=559 /DNA_ID=CAMNT_0013576453 /DNA_START=42 /DNA_END=1722 /DNA_ORIENTATION=-
MATASMRTPAGGSVPSPIHTPAMLQGELPPWAHPTPSPSLMIRRPDLRCGADFRCATDADGSSVGRSGSSAQQHSPELLFIPPELLWGVCMPFIQQMLQALQEAVQREIKARLAASSPPERDGSPPPEAKSAAGAAAASTLQDTGTSPFSSLFNPTPRPQPASTAGLHRTALRSRASGPPGGEPLHEEPGGPSDHELSSSQSSPGQQGSWGHGAAGARSEAVAMLAQQDMSVPQRLTLVPSSLTPSISSSKGASPMPEGKEPPGSRAIARNGGNQASGGCSVGSSPVLQGLEPSWQAVLGSEGSASGVPAGGPIYVRWSQQAGQHWRDQAGEGCSASAAAAPQSRRVLPETPEGASPAGDGTDERSVMVCRHWKSKGWCRLEDACRFLHPEHKRGGTTTGGGGGAKKNTSSGNGAANGGSAAAAAAGGEAKGPSRRTRRSRRGTGGAAAAAAAAAAALGPTPNEANGDGGTGGGGNNGPGATAAAPQVATGTSTPASVPAAAAMAPGLLAHPALPQPATTSATGGSSAGGNAGGGIPVLDAVEEPPLAASNQLSNFMAW